MRARLRMWCAVKLWLSRWCRLVVGVSALPSLCTKVLKKQNKKTTKKRLARALCCATIRNLIASHSVAPFFVLSIRLTSLGRFRMSVPGFRGAFVVSLREVALQLRGRQQPLSLRCRFRKRNFITRISRPLCLSFAVFLIRSSDAKLSSEELSHAAIGRQSHRKTHYS